MRFLFKTIISCSVFFILSSYVPKASDVLLIVNSDNKKKLPRNFRTCQASFVKKPKHSISRSGLSKLNASGSGQFSANELHKLYKKLGKPTSFYVVDLRQESHGLLNDMAVSWFHAKNWGNIEKTDEEIQVEESDNLQHLLADKFAPLHWPQKSDEVGFIGKSLYRRIPVSKVSTEELLVRSLQMQYKRFFVTDFSRPRPQVVDDFVDFIKSTEVEKPWYHFHCKAGRGRTTAFLIMFDMMKNAKTVSIDHIITRHYLMGGSSMDKCEDSSAWRQKHRIARRDFLSKFYKYCRQNKDNFKESWTAYCSRARIDP